MFFSRGAVAVAILLTVATAVIALPSAGAQGCEPIRFTTPVRLGGQGEAYPGQRQWQLTLAYRRLRSDEWFVGTSEKPAMAPGGVSPVFNIQTVIADVGYALTDRITLHASVPFSRGSLSRVGWADGQRHVQTASGIGDVSVQGDVWLLDPRTHEGSNLSLGIGVKAPTGSHRRPSQYYTATGAIPFPADQTIQPGDGGWGISVQTQAFHRVTERWFAYAGGSYMASPRAQSDVLFDPAQTVHWSVPDVYGARLGAAVAALPEQGLTLSLGLRLDGIPRRDLFGGGDSTTIKRTSRILLADPGMSLSRGRNSFTLSVPVRVHVNRIKSIREENSTGRAAINGGGFAKYLVFASYSIRW
ncbi:MAG: hypothetical protein ABI910_21585 [Gemmatimonadota bacterium]